MAESTDRAGPCWPSCTASRSLGLQHVIDGDKTQVGPPESVPVLIVVSLVPDPVQLSMFPIVDRPVSRLAHYAGGIMPAAVALEVEARRRWLGLTQAKLAERIGVSRPQLVNALHGRFGLSDWIASRLREFLLPSARAA